MISSRGSWGAVVGRLFQRMILTESAKTSSRRTFVSTTTVLEKHTMKVPTMGDSITEGTIVEWTAQIGQKVEEEDIVALIETDKVTVDIRATKTGVITQQFGAVDGNIDVGADLCEIDTEAVATTEVTELITEEAAAPSTLEYTPIISGSSSSGNDDSSSQAARTPSIKFLGKDGWAAALTVENEIVLPANYGRLPISEEEMEALVTGGANLAPELKAFSTKALYF